MVMLTVPETITNIEWPGPSSSIGVAPFGKSMKRARAASMSISASVSTSAKKEVDLRMSFGLIACSPRENWARTLHCAAKTVKERDHTLASSFDSAGFSAHINAHQTTVSPLP